MTQLKNIRNLFLAVLLTLCMTATSVVPVFAGMTGTEAGKTMLLDEGMKETGENDNKNSEAGKEENDNKNPEAGKEENDNKNPEVGKEENDNKNPEEEKKEDEKSQKPEWSADGALKILMIGNSYSVDTMQYVSSIARNLGANNVKLGILYIASCNLTKHLSCARNDAASYTYYTNIDGTWVTQANYKMRDAVAGDNWDYISFQQASASSGVPRTYDDLVPLLDLVESWCPNAKYVWNMTWAYQKNTERVEYNAYVKNQNMMYEAITSTVEQKVVTNKKIDQVIPVGTAIQNARTTYLGDTVTRDGYHLSYDIGRYIAGVAFFHGLTGISVDSLSYMPSGTGAGICAIAIESAKNAVKKPFAVTNSEYSTVYKNNYYAVNGKGYCLAMGGAHVEKCTVVPATASADGSISPTCTKCYTDLDVRVIPRIASAALSKTEYNYNGKKKTPSVTVLDVYGNKLVKGTDYTVTYASGRKNVGNYGVTITYKGNYSGTKTLKFTICPKVTSISKMTAKKNQVTVTWKKISAQRTGYQMQYSTKANFSSKKSVKITKNTTSTTIKKLKKNKKYYLRIRTYKKVGTKTYYSAWSAAKSVKTKK